MEPEQHDVNTSQESTGRRVNKRLLFLCSGVVFLLAAAGSAFFVYNHKNQGKDQKPAAAQKYVDTGTLKPQGPLEESTAKSLQGDYDGAQSIVDDAIKTADTSDTKYDLYVQKANNALNADQYDAALDAGMQAAKIKDDYTANLIIAKSHERAGRTVEAWNAYKRTLEIMKRSSDYDQFVPSVERKINALKP